MKIIISGGGTGGHLFPALALADALSNEYKGCDIVFVGAKNKMEMEIVPSRGYKIKGLYISGFHRGEIVRNLFFLLKLLISLIHSFFIIIKYKPDLVIGTGGFASGPILFCATIFEAAVNSTQASSMQDMGKVMGAIKSELQGKADMGLVSQIVKSSLSS